MKALVTGGAGFIGSALVRSLVAGGQASVVNLDALTYAADLERLAGVEASPRYAFEQRDICDEVGLADVFQRRQPDVVVHLAAETHVDRSIDGPEVFMQANVVGTSRLLSAALEYWRGLPAARAERFRFLHVSTDEVFGDLDEDAPAFTEASRYAPSSPYSASKAASDHLVSAWRRTYGLPTLTAHCSNSYGPGQFPEKLIPLTVLNAASGRPIPVYGLGEGMRDWLHVDDQVRALELILEKGVIGRSYNIGGGEPHRAIEVVRAICALLEDLAPVKPAGVRRYEDLIAFVDDRPGHDRRYAMDTTRIERELGWKRRETFEAGLRRTVAWCLGNMDRLKSLQARCGNRRPGLLGTHHGLSRQPTA